jgi:hypothetical protein
MTGKTGGFILESLDGTEEGVSLDLLLIDGRNLFRHGSPGKQGGHGSSLFGLAGGMENGPASVEDTDFQKIGGYGKEIQEIMEVFGLPSFHEAGYPMADEGRESLDLLHFGIKEVLFLILDEEESKDRKGEGDHEPHGKADF